jgi:hypothetical protein
VEPDDWWKSLRGIRDHGEKRLGIQFKHGDSAAMVTAKVFIAAGDGPWLKKVDPVVASFMRELKRLEEAAA